MEEVMANKAPRILSAVMNRPQIVDLVFDNGVISSLDLSADLPPEAGAARVEDWGHSLEFDGTDMDFSSPDLYKRAAWQDGRALLPEVFRAWRKKIGLSQEQLASLFDLGRRTIGYYEDGTLLVPRVVELAMKGYEREPHAAE
jgi:DNA-binding XRE family transcriptional regulator